MSKIKKLLESVKELEKNLKEGMWVPGDEWDDEGNRRDPRTGRGVSGYGYRRRYRPSYQAPAPTTPTTATPAGTDEKALRIATAIAKKKGLASPDQGLINWVKTQIAAGKFNEAIDADRKAAIDKALDAIDKSFAYQSGKMSPEDKAAYEKERSERQAKALADREKYNQERKARELAQQEKWKKDGETRKAMRDFLSQHFPQELEKINNEAETAAVYGETIPRVDVPTLTGDVEQDKAIAQQYIKDWFNAAGSRSRRPWGLGTESVNNLLEETTKLLEKAKGKRFTQKGHDIAMNVKKSEKEAGKSDEDAERIAWATATKQGERKKGK
jgi:hypothetical protein